MAEMDFEKLFSEGVVSANAAVPAGTYTVKVVDARSKEGKGHGTVFLDLEVVEGPYAGELSQVSLFIPDGTGQNPRGAAFFFAKKTGGFTLGAEVGAAMNSGNPAAILAESLVGQIVEAELDVQEGGQYNGSNNLIATKSVGEVSVTEAAPVAKAAVAAPVAEAATDDDVPF